MKRYGVPAIIAACAVVATPYSKALATCEVPGTHTSIQEAVEDPVCSFVDLLPQTYDESVEIRRTLEIRGPSGASAVLRGQIVAAGVGVQLQLTDVTIQTGCRDSALATNGAAVTGVRLLSSRSVALPCPPMSGTVFEDGFESGNTSQWSITVGGA